MAVRAISTLADLQSLIRQPKLTVVDFFAVWCGPCKQIAPHMAKLAEQKPSCNFVKVDVDQAQEIAAEYKIRAMPTFMFFKNGQKVETFEGADFNRLQAIVQQYDIPVVEPLPSDEALMGKTPKELLAIMKAHHISSAGLLEKSDLIDEIKKHR